jgi:DNA-binding NtrC family response regulator
VEDISVYALHFIEKYGAVFGKKVSGVSEGALRLLESHPWNGNIRELENAIQRGLLNASGDMIQETDINFISDNGERSSAQWDSAVGLEPYIKTLSEQAEKRIILESLDRTGWNRTETARQLKISRKTLFNKMHQYGFDEKPDAP